MTRRVVVTGMGGVTALGDDWPTIRLHTDEIADKVAVLKPGDFVEMNWD